MMRNSRAGLLSLVATGFAFVVVPSVVLGQGENPGRPNTPAGTTRDDAVRQPSIRERQYQMMQMEREAAKPQPLTPEQEKLAMAQIAEDYRQIQVINNKMMAAAMKSGELNYANIADTTSEVKSRAMRLRDNLSLTKADQKQSETEKRKPPADAAAFKTELLSLDKSIMSFVESPIFKTPSVINVEDANKARRDLNAVIELSGFISKAAARLKRNSQ